jgi:hypothetical protein
MVLTKVILIKVFRKINMKLNNYWSVSQHSLDVAKTLGDLQKNYSEFLNVLQTQSDFIEKVKMKPFGDPLKNNQQDLDPK